jgi:hypothetical protein
MGRGEGSVVAAERSIHSEIFDDIIELSPISTSGEHD